MTNMRYGLPFELDNETSLLQFYLVSTYCCRLLLIRCERRLKTEFYKQCIQALEYKDFQFTFSNLVLVRWIPDAFEGI